MTNVAAMSFADRLGETLERSLPHLEPEARQRIAELLNPATLGIMAGVLIAWVATHAIGIGEAVDVVLAVVGFASIGLAIFSGLDELWDFAVGVQRGKTDADLDAAVRHFAKAVSILGIEAVLALLFRGRPRTFQGRNVPIGREPPRQPGSTHAHPTTRGDPKLLAGEGSTDAWGNVVYSLRGTDNDRALVLLHERVHQILTPRLYPLRRIRVQNRMNSYIKSSLSRYLEEALAETAARTQVVGGIGSLVDGIRFPVKNGYVTLIGVGKGGVGRGRGVLTETGALIGTGSAAGFTFNIWFRAAPSSSIQTTQTPAVTR